MAWYLPRGENFDNASGSGGSWMPDSKRAKVVLPNAKRPLPRPVKPDPNEASWQEAPAWSDWSSSTAGGSWQSEPAPLQPKFNLRGSAAPMNRPRHEETQDAEQTRIAPPHPASEQRRLRAADIEHGMVVIFDARRRGYIDNCLAEIDEFWVRDETSDEVVMQADGSGNHRTFQASQLRFTGKWARAVVLSDVIEVPNNSQLRGFLLSEGGDRSIQKLQEQLKALMVVDQDCGDVRIVVGPGFAPDVKAASVVVREELQRMDINFGGQPQTPGVGGPIKVQDPGFSWLKPESTDLDNVMAPDDILKPRGPSPEEFEAKAAAEEAQVAEEKARAQEEYQRGFEAAMREFEILEAASKAQADADAEAGREPEQ